MCTNDPVHFYAGPNQNSVNNSRTYTGVFVVLISLFISFELLQSQNTIILDYIYNKYNSYFLYQSNRISKQQQQQQ